MRDIEGDWDGEKVAKGIVHDRIHLRSEDNECITEMDTLHQNRGP